MRSMTGTLKQDLINAPAGTTVIITKWDMDRPQRHLCIIRYMADTGSMVNAVVVKRIVRRNLIAVAQQWFGFGG